jgi:ferredoxin
MGAYTDKIREIAGRLLKDCQVEMVIGFRKGSMPMMNEPCFVTRADAVDQLVWDGSCGINLANYLTGRTEARIGVVAKGCDSRNIVTHIIENKIKREQLTIIGVPCTGMIDKRRLKNLAPGEVLAVEEDGERVVVRGDGFETVHQRREVLQANCAVCHHRNPVIHDELVGDPVSEQTEVDRYADVRAIEGLSAKEKWDYFEALLAPCLRCYACRNACPLCYCPTCFVDEAMPQWVGKSQNPVDVRTFHFLRAYHCAGRCTDCGSCERACPVGINMRLFTKKLEKDAYEMWGWEAGLSLEQRPPLDTYRPEDPEPFIK